MPLKPGYAALFLTAGTALAIGCAQKTPSAGKVEGETDPLACTTSTETGITVPPGFCATVFADNIGHARHLVVAGDGTVYVNTWSGRYYRNAPPPKGAFLVALRDADGDGRAEIIQRFGRTAEEGNSGGTGIAFYKDGLYAETDDRIVRYSMTPGQIVPTRAPVTILSDLPLTGDHPMHPFVIDAKGQMFVNSGSATNTCEERNRQPGSKGLDPCKETEIRGGIWLYPADRPAQKFSAAERYATGIRNTGGMSFDANGRLFAVQHGRDQLGQNWPALYSPEQGVELPAEELLAPVKGSDFGWPYCYYDGLQKRLVLAPEYGGDGGKTAGRCATKSPPVAAFPAHFAPNDVLIYTGQQFPLAYRGGAFIAFHGSWNRAPAPQDGYTVMFQPLQDGRSSGAPMRFADGFAGAFKEPGRAVHRPAGLAMAPDGTLYIADDVKGRIWRITWRGPANAPLAAAVAPKETAASPNTGTRHAATLPPGFTEAQVDLGRRIYLGEVRSGTCSGCHGSDGRGSSAGASLVGPEWLWTDGSIPSLAKVIAAGVPNPRKSGGAMPPKGGTDLSEQDVQAVAAYVWTIGKTH
ncbi:MAG TPA: c-type cytochrome [Sphingobium sp.]|uniref:c-type cytochrome n=1 Tax=Sphingobium sp. TaxID=1912891 RepID=UPI002ED57A13